VSNPQQIPSKARVRKEERLQWTLARKIRADQYRIQTMLRVGDVEIKFEIVFEARIQLEAPITDHKICGISTLTPLDMTATKLLANSDLWADDSRAFIFTSRQHSSAKAKKNRRTLSIKGPPIKFYQLFNL